jgi:hypothetical protein
LQIEPHGKISESVFQERIRVLAPEVYAENSAHGSTSFADETESEQQSVAPDPVSRPAEVTAPVCEAGTPNKDKIGASRSKTLRLVKLRRSRNKDHLRFITIQACTVCGWGAIKANIVVMASPYTLR